jgi:hypothetical protein
VLLQTILTCITTIESLRLIWRGSIGAEYALVGIWSLEMGQGYLRAGAGKSALAGYETWFKRHGWVHAWWMPLMIWIRLLAFLLSLG